MNEEQRKVMWNKIWSKKCGQYLRKHKHMYSFIRPMLKGKILDIACGVTDLYQKGDNVTGLDFSLECVCIMKNRHPWGNWIVGNALDTKLEESSYDTVIASNILEHYEDQAPIISELKRLVRPEGNIVIILPKDNRSKDHVHPTWDESKIKHRIISHLKNASFELKGRYWIIQGAKE
jgi:2-polyprenyl-3-methyl-5-hydroxy-6-metoxy-1,4-benzoquinol methylase